MSTKITQKHSKLHVFSLVATQRETHQSKKAQRKNLAHSVYLKDTLKDTLQSVSSGHASRTNIQCQTQYFLLAPIY